MTGDISKDGNSTLKLVSNGSNSTNTSKNATLVAKKVKVATFASHPSPPLDEDKALESEPLMTAGPASKMVESLVQKKKRELKKDDDLKVEKVNPVQDHKDDIRDAFSGHLKINSTKTAGELKEKPKEKPEPTAQQIDAKTAISGDIGKDGKSVLKLADQNKTINSTANDTSIKPVREPLLVAKKVAQFSSHST